MYTAILYVALISGNYALEDNRGPYMTETQCKNRIEEMKVDMMPTLQENGLRQMVAECRKGDETAI